MKYMTILAAETTLIHYLPIGTTLIAVVFLFMLIQRYQAKGEVARIDDRSNSHRPKSTGESTKDASKRSADFGR